MHVKVWISTKKFIEHIKANIFSFLFWSCVVWRLSCWHFLSWGCEFKCGCVCVHVHINIHTCIFKNNTNDMGLQWWMTFGYDHWMPHGWNLNIYIFKMLEPQKSNSKYEIPWCNLWLSKMTKHDFVENVLIN